MLPMAGSRVRELLLEVLCQAPHRLVSVALVVFAACGTPADDAAPVSRPDTWAVAMERPGLPNLHRVADGLYRGAQPERRGFAELKAMGIKTVVNLRTFHSDRSECRDAGLDYVKISVQAWEGEDDEVVDFLKVATDPARQPVFVHCQHGADRTGVMCAAYRLVVQGWSNDDAVKEMTSGGYGFHAVWENLVAYVRAMDAEKMRAALR